MRQRNLNIRHPIRIKIHTCPKLNVHILCQHNSVGFFFITGTYGIWIDFARKSFLRMRQRNLNIRHPIMLKIHTCPKLNVHILCQHNSAGPFFIIGTYVGSFIAITSKVIVWNHKLSNVEKYASSEHCRHFGEDFRVFVCLPAIYTHSHLSVLCNVMCKTRTAEFYVMFKHS